mgnify:FL=1|jgi:hypothetical protein
MAESTGSESPQPATDEMHWALYLRTDIQDLRQDMRDLRQEARDFRVEVNSEFGTVRSEFRSELAQMRVHTDNRFHWLVGIMLTLFGIQNGVMIALLKF